MPDEFLFHTHTDGIHPAQQVAFLDRDGVLIKNRPDYVLDETAVEVLPGASEAVDWLGRHGYRIIVITNQSAIGRGLLDPARALEIDAHAIGRFGLDRDVFLATYLCPHVPNALCACRKPRPAMIERGIQEFGVIPRKSFLIGDALTDIEAGSAAGLATAMVLSGRGSQADVEGLSTFGATAHPDLPTAVAALHTRLGESS